MGNLIEAKWVEWSGGYTLITDYVTWYQQQLIEAEREQATIHMQYIDSEIQVAFVF